MRSKSITWPVFVLLWLVIYFATITVGVIIVIPITYRAHDHLNGVALSNAEEYRQTGKIPQTSVMFQASAFVYNAEGELTDKLVAEGNHMDFSKRAAKLMSELEREGGVYKLIFDGDLDGRLAMIIGVPLYEDARLDSAYFFVKSLTSQFSNLMILFIALTFMLLLSAIYSGLIIKKDRELEHIRRAYVANVSHDLKSPIASIKSLAEVMSEGIVTDSDKVQKYGDIILKEASSLEKTVLSMLDLSRMQSGNKDFSKTAVDAYDAFSPIIETYGALCDGQEISFHVQDGLSELPELLTNQSCAAELLDTLLDNAVKFVATPGEIRLEWTASPRCLIMSVSDNGAGISREEQRHIFERFYKGEAEGSGSGLGLAIASEIADGLGEKLWVRSEPDKGSAFYFTIHFK